MKEELRLAYKAGALSIITRQNVHLDTATQDRMSSQLEEDFESWYKAILPILRLDPSGSRK